MKLRFCNIYKIDNEQTIEFPTTEKLSKCKPEYITMKGWKEDITQIKKFY